MSKSDKYIRNGIVICRGDEAGSEKGDYMNKNFAENLYRLRKENGLTQEQLAGRLGVSFQSVSKWENNQGYPDIELLPRIASYFHITLDELLGYQSEKIITTHYEGKYHSEEYYWGNQVWSGCYEVLKRKPPIVPLRLLDVGCGEGQAAVFFAKNGYIVSAFDIAQNGIEKGKHLADISNVSVDFFCANLLNYKVENNFNVVYVSGVLQYIPKDRRQEIIDNLKERTNIDGIHILNVFVEKPFIKTAPDWEDTEYFWQSGELLQYYHDWKIELLEEVIFDCDSSHVLHQHCMDVVIGRKMAE